MKKLSTILFTMLLFVSIANLSAQEAPTQPVKINGVSSLGEYYYKYQSRVPAYQFDQFSIAPQTQEKSKGTTALAMPEKFWHPGEFEEMQAILITWPYYHIDKATEKNMLEPVTATLGYRQVATPTGTQTIVEEYISIVDIYSDTRLPIIFAQLANAIQKGNAQVWINICKASDSTTIKNYMNSKGMPLTNYRFFVYPQNSFWYRDCGPMAFYQGDNDDIAFLDMEYYGGRPLDDLIPIHIANEMSYPVYTTSFEMEGGNVLLDGAGTLFTSNQVYAANQDVYGQIYIETDGKVYSHRKTALTQSQVRDSLTHIFGLTRTNIIPTLRNDGGTGHIDLYAGMWDENNFVFTKYPTNMSSQADYTISTQNVDNMLSLLSYHEKNYRGEDIPLPKKDNNTWYTSAADFERYTRTYSNSTFVNNVIIQPIFSDNTWGAREWDLKAIEVMQQRFPGYEIIPIDIRGYQSNTRTGFDGSGGAIHCITKQIPAENPVRILHGSIQGFANEYNNVFPISATITNKSGIASATCYWRVKGETTWNDLSLEAKGNNLFEADLTRSAVGAVDTIEYYISATSNNGKTITKPITAPKGYYSFYYGASAQAAVKDDIYNIMLGVSDYKNEGKESIHIGTPYPNPAKEQVNIMISDMDQQAMQVQMINTLGQVVYSNAFTPEGNSVLFQLKTDSFTPGVYTILFVDQAGRSAAKKVVVQ